MKGLWNRPYMGYDSEMSLCRGLLKPGRRAGLLPPCRSSRSQDSTDASPCDPDGLHTALRVVLCWMDASAHTWPRCLYTGPTASRQDQESVTELWGNSFPTHWKMESIRHMESSQETGGDERSHEPSEASLDSLVVWSTCQTAVKTSQQITSLRGSGHQKIKGSI